MPPTKNTTTVTTATTPVLITISGGEASGKKTVLSGLRRRLVAQNPSLRVRAVHMSDFGRKGGGGGGGGSGGGGVGAFDLERMADEVEGSLKKGGGAAGGGGWDVVIAEGRYLLSSARLVALANVKIFVDCDPDVRLARKVVRDSENNISLDSILDQYIRHSKPAFEQVILPKKSISDIILPGGAEGPGLDLIAHGVMDDIKGRRRGRSLSGIRSSASHSQLPLMLSEVDLATGAPSYYQTV